MLSIFNGKAQVLKTKSIFVTKAEIWTFYWSMFKKRNEKQCVCDALFWKGKTGNTAV